LGRRSGNFNARMPTVAASISGIRRQHLLPPFVRDQRGPLATTKNRSRLVGCAGDWLAIHRRLGFWDLGLPHATAVPWNPNGGAEAGGKPSVTEQLAARWSDRRS